MRVEMHMLSQYAKAQSLCLEDFLVSRDSILSKNTQFAKINGLKLHL